MQLIGYRGVDGEAMGALHEDGTVTPLAPMRRFWADPFKAVTGGAAERLAVGDVELVPPIWDGARVLCVGLNYAAHVDEGPFDRPEYPTIFARWTASLAVSGAEVVVPVDEAGLDWEGELLAVVGRPLKNVTPQEGAAGVFAYAAFNDITARRAQKLTSQWTIGKNADNSGVVSPLRTVEEVGDPADGLRIVTTVNGEVMQDGKTDELLFSVGDILAFCSRTFQLRPGDVVATGTPSGVGYARTPPRLLQPGDTVDVQIERVGSVSTSIVGGDPR